MVLYLLRDLLWRNWTMYALMGPIICVFWMPIVLLDMEPRWGITFSLFMAVALGPMTSISTVGLREIRLLPIRFRDLWTLTWLASTVVPSLFVLLTTAAGVALAMKFGRSAHIGLETPVLVALYSYVFTNAVLVLLPALNYTSRNMRPGATTTAIMFSILFLFIGSLGVPYVLAPYLPTSFGQLTGGSIAMLATGIAASFGVLAWRPSAGIGTGVANRSQTESHRSTPRVMDGLTGLSRVILPYWILTAALSVIAVGGCAWYLVSRGGGDVAALIADDVVPMAYMLIGMVSPWMSWARLLKIFPLRTWTINLLFLATPLVTWLVIAATLALLEYAVGPAVPAWFSANVLLWFGGLGALVNALAFRHQGSVLWVVGPVTMTSPFVRGPLEHGADPWSFWFVVGGVAAFATAAWINHRTLTRCGSASRAFRRPVPGLLSPSGPVAPR